MPKKKKASAKKKAPKKKPAKARRIARKQVAAKPRAAPSTIPSEPIDLMAVADERPSSGNGSNDRPSSNGGNGRPDSDKPPDDRAKSKVR
jgi:hypothetical protein